MRRPFALIILFILCGCPGQRRPPPALPQEAPPADAVPETPTAPPPVATSITGLKQGMVELRSERDGFVANPGGTAAHDKLMLQVNALQSVAFKLQDSEDEAVLDEVYPLLEELEELRDDIVQLEPK